MTDNSTQLRQALQDLADEGRYSSEPLDAKLLVAYTNDELSEAEAERVRDHLVGCSESRELLRELSRFSEAPEERTTFDEDELEDAWQRVRSQIFPPVAPSAAPAPLDEAKLESGWYKIRSQIFPPVQPWRTSPLAWMALAGVLALACVGLGIWGVSQQHAAQKLSRPVANVVIEDLYPIDDPLRQREPAASNSFELAETARELVLVLHSIEARPGLRARLFGPGGHELWHSPILEVGTEGTVILAIPRSSLSNGTYRIVLSEDSPGESPQIFAFEICFSKALPVR